LVAKSWASAFPELTTSRALVARLEKEKIVYEEALAAGSAEAAELQLVLVKEVIVDNVAGFAAALGARDPKLNISRVVCPELPVWELLDWDKMPLPDLAVAMGARAITRLLLGLFGSRSRRRFASLRVGVGRRGAHSRDLGPHSR
jgi:hypothetical protein